MNGILLNGHRIHRASVILMDGDQLRFPHTDVVFTCVYIWKESREKAHIFDPTPSSQLTQRTIGNFVVTSHTLGSGTFATVNLAIDTQEHRQVACKTIKTRSSNDVKKIQKEVDILMKLDHPNINSFLDKANNGKFLHLFLELAAHGDLFTYITCNPSHETRLCEAEAKYIMYQLFCALKCIHDKNISHRDLKPENILLHTSGPYPCIQIADFGLARLNAYQETLNVVGTIGYLPPEGILALDNNSRGYLGMPADVWSAGVIMYIMLTGTHPYDRGASDGSSLFYVSESVFYGEDNKPDSQRPEGSQMWAEQRVKQRIVNNLIDFWPGTWDQMPDAKGLVQRLMSYDRLGRATILQALDSRWIDSEAEGLKQAYYNRIIAKTTDVRSNLKPWNSH